MAKILSLTSKKLFVAIPLSLLLVPSMGAAQTNAKVQVLTLVRDAMDAYSNLDLDTATANLEEALGFAPDLDKPALARVYVSYGIVWIGGFGDNAKGQHDFTTALCLDGTISVDPLLSSPDIDLVFSMAKQQVPGKCAEVLATVVVPGGGSSGAGGGAVSPPVAPAVPSCGQHTPITESRQKWEVPFYIEMDPAMRGRVMKMVVKYAFDGGTAFRDANLVMAGQGFGAMVTCDEGQIRVYDPASISYYIEGYDQFGNLVCGNASAQGPQIIAMNPDAAALPQLPGMAAPKECAPCPPWDESCGSTLPKEGDVCTPGTGCADGLVCGDAGICEAAKERGPVKGPSKFYVNVGGGAGFGFMSDEIRLLENTEVVDGAGEVSRISDAVIQGGAFGGIPLRLMVGFHVTPRLSLEVTGRFDVMVSTMKTPKSCEEALKEEYGDSWADELPDATCTGYPTPGEHPTEGNADRSVATDGNGNSLEREEKVIAWMVNARVKFRLLQKGGLHLSLFGGVGYGKLKYRIASGDVLYFPAPTGVNIELGPELAIYFNDHVGLVFEIPIDAVFLDGWAINFDLFVGLSFGF